MRTDAPCNLAQEPTATVSTLCHVDPTGSPDVHQVRAAAATHFCAERPLSSTMLESIFWCEQRAAAHLHISMIFCYSGTCSCSNRCLRTLQSLDIWETQTTTQPAIEDPGPLETTNIAWTSILVNA